MVKPRSFLAFSAISLIADTPVPNWRRTMFLLFCAQIIGAPTVLPRAAPATTPAPLRMLRRENPLLGPPFSFAILSTPSPFLTARCRLPLTTEDVHVPGHPRQSHRLARHHRR